MSRVAGADGCSAGWICLVRNPQTEAVDGRVVMTADLPALVADLDVLAVDIPIGLPDKGHRECDILARRLLGRHRAGSVFPSPVRAALCSKTRKEASDITSRIDGRKISAQAWGIFPKIREVDELLRDLPEFRRTVREVHPEVSFWEWNGRKPIPGGKKTLDGMIARLDLVLDHFGRAAFRRVRDAWPHRSVADDDILDAFAALWTAERIACGEAARLPPDPPLDSAGLRMEIVY